MKKFVLFSFLGALVLFFFFKEREGTNTIREGEKEKIVYKHFFDSPVHSVDPLDAADIYTQKVVLSVYDTLYEYRYLERPYTLKPSLASDFPEVSEDSLVYTIPLKKGVFFPDDPCFEGGKGREVLASDFIYSFLRHFDKENLSTASWITADKIVGLDSWSGFAFGGEPEGLKSLDSHTIQIRLKQPFPQLLPGLALAFSAIVPREAVEYYGEEFPRHPVGSGAWKLKSLDSKKIVLTANPQFRKEFVSAQDLKSPIETISSEFKKLEGKKLPLCDEIEIHCFPSAEEAWWAFQNGESPDYVTLPSKVQDSLEVPSFEEEMDLNFQGEYTLYRELSDQMRFWGFNMAHPSFGSRPDNPVEDERNKALRQAIRYAFDWKKVIERSYSGRGRLFPGISPNVFDGEDGGIPLDSITYQPEKAKALLKKYGWTPENLPTLVYTGVANVAVQQDFLLFQSFYTKIGYPKEKVKSVLYSSFQELFSSLRKSEHPSFGYLTWHADIPDACDFLQAFYSANKAPGINISNYENAEFDALYEKIFSMKAGPERARLIQKAVRIFLEDSPMVSGFSPYNVHLWRKNFLLLPNQKTNFFKYVARVDSLD